MSKIIGIDLGTTKSCVAVIENSKSVIIKNAEGEMTTPSVVAFSKAGERLVGEPARRQAVTNEERTFVSFKRDIGTDNSRIIDGREYFPWQIYAMILKKLKVDAENYLCERVTEAVITVPTYFDGLQRQEVMDAARLAGLDVKRIISDSTAAALAYGINISSLGNHEEPEKIMIYDLGGGNFNVAIIEIGDGVVEAIAVNGASHLGGDDFDKRIVQWMLDEFKNEVGEDISIDKIGPQRLKEAAEKAKKELSHAMATDIHIPFFTITNEGSRHFDGVLTRTRFEELTSDLVEKTVNLAQRVIEDAGLTASDLKQIFLVGASTRIPAVQEKLRLLTGKEPRRLLNLDEYVAIGASIQGGKMSGDAIGENILFLDVVPMSLSIETKGGFATRLIERNTTIPTKHSQFFSAIEDNQTVVDIQIVQGEGQLAKDNRLLGQFRLDGIIPAKKGEPWIEVTFSIDANGILDVTVKDMVIGKVIYETIPIPQLFWNNHCKLGEINNFLPEVYRKRQTEEGFRVDL